MRQIPRFTLAQNGFFEKDGKSWIPAGFNYWPPESGVDCWTDDQWSADAFRRDFAAMAERGFDCVRMFLRWPEFQPTENRLEAKALKRLAEVGEAARETGIYLIPTLFVGFMSGGLYPPPWLNGRNLFTDPACVKAAGLLATAAARALAPSGMVLAYDFSNEINVWCNHLPPVTTAEAIAWQRTMVAAIRRGHPGALAMNGTNHTGIIAEVPWNLKAQSQVPLDLLSMHVYPVRVWNPLLFSSLQEYEADILAPVHVAMGRVYGPVMMQEFGVAVPVGGQRAADYLRISTVGCWLDGSNGFLMWGWQDFQTRAKPYRDNPFEKEICYLDNAGQVKEAGQGYAEALDFIRPLAGFAAPTPEIGIYLGDAYWEGCHATLGNSLRCFWLSAALRRAHLPHAFTDTIDPRFKVIVIPGPRLNLDEISALQKFVAGGGRILLGNIRFCYWCDDLKDLADLDIIDMTSLTPGMVLRGEKAEFAIPGVPYLPLVAPRRAAVLATAGDDKIPALLVSDRGHGRVATLFAPLGEELSEHPARLQLDRLLAPLFARWGIKPVADGLPPEVEGRIIRNDAGEERLVLLNHGLKSFSGKVTWAVGQAVVKLAAKAVAVLDV